MRNLGPEEQAILEQLRIKGLVRLGVSGDQCRSVDHPEDFVAPVGLDNEGELYPDSPPPPPTSTRANAKNAVHETDLVAVRTYLTRFHGAIDQALRTYDQARLREFDAHIRLTTFGLYHMSPYQGVVYRGTQLSDALVRKYMPGTIIQERAFVRALANPLRYFPGNAMYIIHCVNGRLVRSLSDDPAALDVLFFTATRFKVLAVDVNADAKTNFVYLAEIADPRLIPPKA